MKFPIELDSPEMRLAEAIATDLAIDGILPGLALPVAIKIMSACEAGKDDPDKGVQELQARRRESDLWWIEYWPKTKTAKEARKRLNVRRVKD
jgi:hypothetical protein